MKLPALRRLWRFLTGPIMLWSLAAVLGLLVWGRIDSERYERQAFLRVGNWGGCYFHAKGVFDFGFEGDFVRAADTVPQGISMRAKDLRPLRRLADGTLVPVNGGGMIDYGGIPYGLPILVVIAIETALLLKRVAVWSRVPSPAAETAGSATSPASPGTGSTKTR